MTVARDPNTPDDVTLGEVYRLLGDVRDDVSDVRDDVSDVDTKVDALNQKGLPQRVKNLETWRDRALIALAGLAVTGGTLAGLGIS